MAAKGKTKKRGKKLASGKKLKKVEPLLYENLTEVQTTKIPVSGGAGSLRRISGIARRVCLVVLCIACGCGLKRRCGA